jgi:hypothetical protein
VRAANIPFESGYPLTNPLPLDYGMEYREGLLFLLICQQASSTKLKFGWYPPLDSHSTSNESPDIFMSLIRPSPSWTAAESVPRMLLTPFSIDSVTRTTWTTSHLNLDLRSKMLWYLAYPNLVDPLVRMQHVSDMLSVT